MAATAANMDSNGRLRMASMAMAEVGLERGSDTTHKQNLAATHAHCTAGYSWPRDKAYAVCLCLPDLLQKLEEQPMSSRHVNKSRDGTCKDTNGRIRMNHDFVQFWVYTRAHSAAHLAQLQQSSEGKVGNSKVQISRNAPLSFHCLRVIQVRQGQLFSSGDVPACAHRHAFGFIFIEEGQQDAVRFIGMVDRRNCRVERSAAAQELVAARVSLGFTSLPVSHGFLAVTMDIDIHDALNACIAQLEPLSCGEELGLL